MIDLKDSLMTDILPGHLATAEVKALAYAVGRQIRQLCSYADKSRTYAALASAPDTVLDALAAELRTPAYDETLPVETKRELVASTLTFYTHLGTPAALEQLILDTIEYYETGAEAVAFTAAAFIGCELVDSCTAENYN